MDIHPFGSDRLDFPGQVLLRTYGLGFRTMAMTNWSRGIDWQSVRLCVAHWHVVLRAMVVGDWLSDAQEGRHSDG